MTLKFLGRTWPRLVDWVPEQVEAAAADVPRSRSGVRGGRGASRPPSRAGRSGPGSTTTDLITDLATEHRGGAVEEFPAEKRPFHPHLTVARSDPPVKLPPSYTATPLETDPWEVDRVVLFRSHLGRPAPRYEPLARFPLGA